MVQESHGVSLLPVFTATHKTVQERQPFARKLLLLFGIVCIPFVFWQAVQQQTQSAPGRMLSSVTNNGTNQSIACFDSTGVLSAEAITFYSPKLILSGGPLSITGAMSGQVPCNADTCSGETCCGTFDNTGGVFLYFFVVLYTFLGLAIICDEYFCDSLEKISEALKLSEDVAGATFMAAGSSAPELFTSVVTTLITESSEGLGTIVGSAVFNIMIIVGVTAIFAGSTLDIFWYPLTRDCIAYVISIVLMLVILWDGMVYWHESVILICGYVGYIALMVKNEDIANWVTKGNSVQDEKVNNVAEEVTTNDIVAMAAKLKAQNSSVGQPGVPGSPKKAFGGPPIGGEAAPPRPDSKGSERPQSGAEMIASMAFSRPKAPSASSVASQPSKESLHSHAKNPMLNPAFRHTMDSSVSKQRGEIRKLYHEHFSTTITVTKAAQSLMSSIGRKSDATLGGSWKVVESTLREPSSGGTPSTLENAEAVTDSPLDIPEEKEEEDGIGDKVLNLVAIPLTYLFMFTIPDCRKENWEKWFVVTFIMSVVWIGVLSFIMVDFGARAGCVLGVPGIAMGIIVLAAGTSVPDAIASIMVAKNGQGDMAVANVLGSNVFNIFLGLGFPWLIKNLTTGAPIAFPANGIISSTIILLMYVVIFIGVIAGSGWQLKPKVGYVFFAAHLFFVAWAFLTMLSPPVISIGF